MAPESNSRYYNHTSSVHDKDYKDYLGGEREHANAITGVAY